jgi:hypothetical protein
VRGEQALLKLWKLRTTEHAALDQVSRLCTPLQVTAQADGQGHIFIAMDTCNMCHQSCRSVPYVGCLGYMAVKPISFQSPHFMLVYNHAPPEGASERHAPFYERNSDRFIAG